jgi:hypothetical protein
MARRHKQLGIIGLFSDLTTQAIIKLQSAHRPGPPLPSIPEKEFFFADLDQPSAQSSAM